MLMLLVWGPHFEHHRTRDYSWQALMMRQILKNRMGTSCVWDTSPVSRTESRKKGVPLSLGLLDWLLLLGFISQRLLPKAQKLTPIRKKWYWMNKQTKWDIPGLQRSYCACIWGTPWIRLSIKQLIYLWVCGNPIDLQSLRQNASYVQSAGTNL